MRTDYVGHNKRYQRLKAEGQPGWATMEQVAEYLKILEQWIEAGHIPKSGKILELGCGDGVNTVWLAERGYEVSGVDIAPTAIEWAKEKAAAHKLEIDFQVGDVLALANYSDNTFDILIDGHCLHCIIGADRKLFLASALRVLKPGGSLFVCTMCGEPRHPDVQEHFDPGSRCMIYQGDLATRYIGLPEDIVAEIEAAGFRILRWEVNSDDAEGCDDLLVSAMKP